ncbi:MAG: HAD-IIIA family hydrolase [Crocinitomicaceae bacterium]|tara:strand:+ start:14906 stop:15448 length:543 start_codon:yes stop_codon:yes gene_type:complete
MIKDWNLDASWSLFLDRDGVINERVFGGYILNKADFVFKEGVLETASKLFVHFKRVCVVTNQQCIGKGMVTHSEIQELHAFMGRKLDANGAHIDEVFIAPELNNERSMQRKPRPKMGLLAKALYPEIDFSKSIMVGDTDSDIEFGKNLGMKTVLIVSKEVCHSSPDLKVTSLKEFNSLLK